jgi:thymidylate synthase (FAD)
MEFLVAGYEIIEQEPGLEGVFKAAELPGRICYGSQDKMGPGTAEKFVNGLMKSNHGAPLEHGTVYLKGKLELDEFGNPFSEWCPLCKYEYNPYSKYYNDGEYVYVTTNLRVLFENGWLSDLDNYLCEPTEYHERRYQVRFQVDRFTGEEFLRHRKASFNRESTRYVLFTKEKFGGGSIKYIVPVWMLDRMDEVKTYKNWAISDFCRDVIDAECGDSELVSDIFVWEFALKACEWSYCKLTDDFGWRAEQARTVLPCAINSPLIKTAFVSDWKNFFNLRAKGTTGKPHPQAKELAEPLMNEFIERGYITEEEIKNNK